MRPVKHALSWLELHPRISTMFGLIAAAGAMFALVLTFYFHGQENSKIKAERVARQAAAVAQEQSSRTTAAAIRQTLCPLIYRYVHLAQPSPNGADIAAGWHGVGQLVGCPYGTKP